jgi:type II secretory pathway pseudopilin PulG
MTPGRSPGPVASARAGERGFSIAVLLAGITIMFIAMGAAVPTWRYVMKNDREEELYFRGDQIARAIERYQRKNANSLPVSFELLVKGKYLRKIYKDPMSKDGKWRIIHPGEAMVPGSRPGGLPSSFATPGAGTSLPGGGGTGPFGESQGGLSPMGGAQTGGRRPGSGAGSSTRPGPGGMSGMGGGPVQGAIIGVASTNTDKSLRMFNGRTQYDQWLFVANQPRLLGGDQGPAALPGGMGPGGIAPTPLSPAGFPGTTRRP